MLFLVKSSDVTTMQIEARHQPEVLKYLKKLLRLLHTTFQFKQNTREYRKASYYDSNGHPEFAHCPAKVPAYKILQSTSNIVWDKVPTITGIKLHKI